MNRIRSAIKRGAPAFGAGTLIGLVAAGVAVSVGELVAVFTGPQTAPAVAVGSAAIDLTPTPLKEFAIRNFGTHDKVILLTGIYATLAVIALAAGVLATRRLALGLVVIAGFGALGAWAALSRPVAATSGVWPSVLGAVVAGAVMVMLARARPRSARAGRRRDGHDPASVKVDASDARQPEPTRPTHESLASAAASGDTTANRQPPLTPQEPESHDRRTFLALTAGTAAAATVTGLTARTAISHRYDVAAQRARVRIPKPATAAPALPAHAHPNVAGLAAFFTPNADFYRVDTALVLPQIDPDAWTLRIRGMVDKPLELSFADLLGRSLVEHDQTLSCVSNEVGGPYVGTARWIGAPLADLLREAGVRRGADQLVGHSADGMTNGTPIASVLDGRQALLAVAMNGEPLPIAHGFPCRMLVPGFFGYVSATKWLVDLEVTTYDAYDPYWVRRGWSKVAPVKTASRIDVPKPFAHVSAGTVTVAGVAWSTHVGIDAVEVRADGGPWTVAHLSDADGPDTWRQWSCDLVLTSGLRRLEVRATDASGAVQTEQRVGTFPNGSTGWHSVVITVN